MKLKCVNTNYDNHKLRVKNYGNWLISFRDFCFQSFARFKIEQKKNHYFDMNFNIEHLAKNKVQIYKFNTLMFSV